MTPADAKDWWLAAAALSSAFIPSTHAQDKVAAAPEKAGVVSGVQPGVKSTTNERVIYVGSDAYRGEKFVTDGSGSLHILFMDQSSMTLGPNSELTIDEFVYDPNAKKGKIGVSLASGLLRVVGGQISKTNETTVKTASGTIGIRGGISVVQQTPSQTTANFLFGQSMRMSSPDGSNTQTVTRQGFGVTSSNNSISSPTRVPSSQFTQLMGQFENQTSTPPTGSTQPGGAPPGQLLSTGGSSGGTQNLAGDRVSNTVSTTLQNSPPSTDQRSPNQDVSQNNARQQPTPPVPVS